MGLCSISRLLPYVVPMVARVAINPAGDSCSSLRSTFELHVPCA